VIVGVNNQQVKRGVFLTVVALVSMLLISAPVLAFLTNPVSMSMIKARWFQNCSSTNGRELVFVTRIEYSGSYPTTSGSETIMYRVYDTDGTTLISSTAPYTFSSFATNGYGYIISGMHFTDADGIAWGGAYKLTISGLPSYFTGLTPVTYTFDASHWNTDNATQEVQQSALEEYIYELADDFNGYYPSAPLITTTGGQTSLTIYGESYLTGAIPGLYALCPDLYFIQYYIPAPMPTETPNMDTADDLKAHTTGTDLMRGLRRTGELIGVNEYVMVAILTFIIDMGIAIWAVRKQHDLMNGLMIASVFTLLSCVLVGDIMFTVVMVATLLAVIVLAWVFWLKRST
jgi:hypothetical protein